MQSTRKLDDRALIPDNGPRPRERLQLNFTEEIDP